MLCSAWNVKLSVHVSPWHIVQNVQLFLYTSNKSSGNDERPNCMVETASDKSVMADSKAETHLIIIIRSNYAFRVIRYESKSRRTSVNKYIPINNSRKIEITFDNRIVPSLLQTMSNSSIYSSFQSVLNCDDRTVIGNRHFTATR